MPDRNEGTCTPHLALSFSLAAFGPACCFVLNYSAGFDFMSECKHVNLYLIISNAKMHVYVAVLRFCFQSDQINDYISMCCRWLSLQFSSELVFIDIFCDENYLIAFYFCRPFRLLPSARWAAARAKIIGSQEVHIKKGSTISLTCMVNIYGSAISW